MIENEKKEQRIFARFAARFPVNFKNLQDEDKCDVYLRDASAQGLKFTTTKRLFKNDNVSLDINIPDGFAPLTLNCKVVWTKLRAPNLWDVGLAFHKVNLMKVQRLYKATLNEDELH